MSRAMLLAVLIVHLAGNASAAVVAEWKMDEGAGSSAADTQGGSALTWNATTNIGWAGTGGAQSPSDALSFDGVDYPNSTGSFPTLPAYKADGAGTDSNSSSHLEFGMGSFTVALEFRSTEADHGVLGGGGALFNKGNTDHRYSFIWLNNDFIGMEYDSMSNFASDGITPVPNNGKSQIYVSTAGLNLSDGQWHQLIATVDRSELDFGGAGASPYGTLRFRIDGTIIGEIAAVSDTAFDEPNTAFNVGFLDWAEGYEFSGDIDNVSVYNTAEISIPTFDPADFNKDTFVDVGDLTKWEGDYGINGNSDADGDGDSDGNDFLLWQRSLTSPPPLSSSSAVPEPSTFRLLTLASLGVALLRKRKV